MRYLLILFALITGLYAQTLPSDAPNATISAKGMPVCINLRYADAPALAMLFSNQRCQGMPLRYGQLMMMSGGGAYGRQNGWGNQGQGQGFGQQNGWNNQGMGQGQGFGRGGQGQNGRGRNNWNQ